MPMSVEQKQTFIFKMNVNGQEFSFGRMALTQAEAAKSIADDLDVIVIELRKYTKAETKSN